MSSNSSYRIRLKRADFYYNLLSISTVTIRSLVNNFHYNTHYNNYIRGVKVFLPIDNGQIPTQGFTSLKGACKALDVDYSQAVRGKRNWPLYKEIREIEIIKQVRVKG